MNRVCIIVPVYNHPDFLGRLLDALTETELPVLLVNDGSDADCSQLMRQLADERPSVDLVERGSNGGKGAAVKTGLEKAREMGFSHALQIDADGQHDTQDIPRLLACAERNPGALVSGEPRFEDIPRLRYYGRYATHVWVWINTLSMEIRDSMCGFRVYPVDATCRVIRHSRIGDRMDFDTEIMVRLFWEGVRVIQVPSAVIYPQGGVSHFRGWQDNLLISRMHARLFFGMLQRLPRLLARRSRSDG